MVVFAILIKSSIYGLSVFVTGTLTDRVDVLDILSLRYLITFSVLLLLRLVGIIKINVRLKDLFAGGETRKNLSILLMAGIFEPVLCIFFETAGLSMTTGITAGIIIAFSPIFTCLFETIFLKEKNSLAQKIFLGIGIVGICYVVVNTKTNSGEDSLLGICLMFASIICGQMYCVCTRKVKGVYRGFDVSFVMATLGFIVFNGINLVRHLIDGSITRYFAPFADPQNLIAFIYLGIVCSVVATTLGNFTFRRAQLSSISAFGGVSTLVTIFAGVFFAGETLYHYHIIGTALIFIRIIGVNVLDIKKRKKLSLEEQS